MILILIIPNLINHKCGTRGKLHCNTQRASPADIGLGFRVDDADSQ